MVTKVIPGRTSWVWRCTSELQLVLPSSIRYLWKAECLGICLTLLTVAWKGLTFAGKVHFLLTGYVDCQLSCPVLGFFFYEWFYLEWVPAFFITSCKSLHKLLPNTVCIGVERWPSVSKFFSGWPQIMLQILRVTRSIFSRSSTIRLQPCHSL